MTSKEEPQPTTTLDGSSVSVMPGGNAASMINSREMNDMQAKIRILERQRLDDRNRLLEFDRMKQDREKLERVIARLEGKIKPMFDSQQELRDQVRTLEDQKRKLEEMLKERDEMVELLTLDREVAEQDGENLREELEDIKARLEEATLELEIMKEENEVLRVEMVKETKTDGNVDVAAVRKLEEQNSRLKEALIRLRDQNAIETQNYRTELKRLQRDSEILMTLKEKYETVVQQFQRAEEIADNLRQQLDVASGADRMLDELTVKNLDLSEQVEKMRISIQDLETLRDINEEIEANHLETERQLQEEIGYRDFLLREQAERLIQIEDSNADYEYTVKRFRELVTALQSDLERLREEKTMEEAEAAQISRRTREMFDLNRKLQESARYGQVRTVDLELRRLEAQEAVEHLSIIRLYLPDSVVTVAESVKTLLCLKRIAFKAGLICSMIRDASIATNNLTVEPTLGTELCDKMARISMHARCLSATMSICSVADFETFGAAVNSEISGTEAVLDGCIATIKENSSFRETGKLTVQLDEALAVLSELYATKGVGTELVKMGDLKRVTATELALLTRSNIDSMIAMMQNLLVRVSGELPPLESSVNGQVSYEAELAASFKNTTEMMIGQGKSMKVLAAKSTTIIDEGDEESKCPTDDLVNSVKDVEEVTRKVTVFVRNVSFSIMHKLDAASGDDQEVRYDDIQKIMMDEADDAWQDSSNSNAGFFAGCRKQLAEAVSKLREVVARLPGSQGMEHYTKVVPPWVSKVESLKEDEALNKDVHARFVQLEEAMKEMIARMRTNERELEESSMKNNFLESRLQKNKERLERLSTIETELAEHLKIEKSLKESVANLNSEVKRLTDETSELRRAVEESAGAASELERLKGRAQVASSEEVEALYRQVSALQSTVRYLSTPREREVDEILAFLQQPIINRARGTEAEEEKRRRKMRENEVSTAMDSLVRQSLTSEMVKIRRGATARDRRVQRNQDGSASARQATEYRQLAARMRALVQL